MDWSAASALSASALTATPCSVLAVASWNGCSTVDHDHGLSRLRDAGCVVGGATPEGAKSQESARSASADICRGQPQRGPNTPTTIMGGFRQLDHLAGPDHCCRQYRTRSGRRICLRRAAGHGHRRPPDHPVPTTKIRPPGASRCRAGMHRIGVLPSGRPGAIRCAGDRRRRLRSASRGPSSTYRGRGPGQLSGDSRHTVPGTRVFSSWRGPGRSRWRPVRRCRRRWTRSRPASRPTKR